MATSPDAFDNPGQMAANIQQQFGGWAENGQRPYAKGLMGIGMIKSLSIYDMSINTIQDIIARFNRFQYVEPGDVNVDNEAN